MGLEGPEFRREQRAVTVSLGVGNSVCECFFKKHMQCYGIILYLENKKLDWFINISYRKQNARVILGSGDGEKGGHVFLVGQGGSVGGQGKTESKGVGQREVLSFSEGPGGWRDSRRYTMPARPRLG